MSSVMICTKLDENAKLPTYAHETDAGLDLVALEDTEIEKCHIWTPVKTGISVKIPNNFYGKIASRSGLALKRQIDAFDGVIDSSFTGHLIVMLRANNPYDRMIKAGDRIAQLVILPYEKVSVVEGSMPVTDRGDKGFGSTGR